MRSALAAGDMGAVITIFRRWTGASQTDIGVLLGMPQPHVSDFERGIRHATSLAMFERLADGLGIPRPPSDSPTRSTTTMRPRQGAPVKNHLARSPPFARWTSWRGLQSKAGRASVSSTTALRLGSSSSRASQTRTAAITPTCMAGSPASKSSPPWPSTIERRRRRTAPSTTCRWMAGLCRRPCLSGRAGCRHGFAGC